MSRVSRLHAHMATLPTHLVLLDDDDDAPLALSWKVGNGFRLIGSQRQKEREIERQNELIEQEVCVCAGRKEGRKARSGHRSLHMSVSMCVCVCIHIHIRVATSQRRAQCEYNSRKKQTICQANKHTHTYMLWNWQNIKVTAYCMWHKKPRNAHTHTHIRTHVCTHTSTAQEAGINNRRATTTTNCLVEKQSAAAKVSSKRQCKVYK